MLHYVKILSIFLLSIFYGVSYSQDTDNENSNIIEKIGRMKSDIKKNMLQQGNNTPNIFMNFNRPNGLDLMKRESMSNYIERRKDILKLYNIKENESQLYIFISMSMPDAMLRGYALEASKTGATLVLRGIHAGQDMKTFIQKTMTPMIIKDLGVLSKIEIDPRLFDAYNVKVVPTMILDEKPESDPCHRGVEDRMYTFRNGQSIQFKGCQRKSEDEHIYRLTGATTLLYALEEFSKHGSREASKRIDMMRKIDIGKPNKQASMLTEQELEDYVRKATAKVKERISNP